MSRREWKRRTKKEIKSALRPVARHLDMIERADIEARSRGTSIKIQEHIRAIRDELGLDGCDNFIGA